LTLSDFTIDGHFFCADKPWRCTDVGTRVITAICLSEHPDEHSWFNGPPYAVSEIVFDEYAQEGCSIVMQEDDASSG